MNTLLERLYEIKARAKVFNEDDQRLKEELIKEEETYDAADSHYRLAIRNIQARRRMLCVVQESLNEDIDALWRDIVEQVTPIIESWAKIEEILKGKEVE